jgi:hypothetical protein
VHQEKAVTNLEKQVARRTGYEVQGKKLIATMHKDGITFHLERSRQKHKVSWARLYAAAYNLPGPVKEGETKQ